MDVTCSICYKVLDYMLFAVLEIEEERRYYKEDNQFMYGLICEECIVNKI